MINLWNHTFFPDEEEEIGEQQRRQLHLILGRRDDGSIISLRFQGALSDAMAWFGGEDIAQNIKDVVEGKETILQKAKEAAMAPAIKIINGIRSDLKSFSEIISERSFYPDPFNPRPIRDKFEHISRLFSLNSIYRWLAGKPKRGEKTGAQLLNDLISIGAYTSDPGEIAYYDIIKKVYDYKEKVLGDERPGIIPSDRSNALYYYKQALKYGDLKAAERYLDKYFELGGTRKGLKLSIKRAHPLASMAKKDWKKFLDTLSIKEMERYRLALRWYNQT